ncbi:MAG: glycosyltransferase [Verrucomicrobia bacterium]|nr:glycosyltransferase [Verrucomicrobiota bacterium]
MSRDLPVISIIIPAPPDLDGVKSAEAARQMDFPRDQIEILVARGRQPSAQRNRALREARGELIYFLDDDVLPDPANLRRIVETFGDSRVAMLGGPNLCPADAPALERIFSLVLSAWLAFGPSRARYAQVGRRRVTSEKELILCNLAARRDAVLALGGFDESLYPNEENALMDGLQAQGRTLIYDPEFSSWRRPRPTLAAFFRMLMTYGRGRAEQFRRLPTPGSALNFVPPLFCIYLLLLPLATVWHWIAWPLVAYGVGVVLQTLALVPRGGLLALPALPLIVLTHVLYGLGFWKGLFTPFHNRASAGGVPVSLEVLKP